MPGKVFKQVRFSRRNTYHGGPSTPSPTYSQSTLPSSPGVLTPPSLTIRPLPTSYYPSKSTHYYYYPPPPGKAHFLLTPSHHPALSYDLTTPPSTVFMRYSSNYLFEPAVTPPLRSMTLMVPNLPWKIPVSARRNGRFVTVSDVLEAMCTVLRANITSPEFYSLPSDKDRHRITAAYEKRYRRLSGFREYEHEKSGGVKRVDFLLDRTRFVGLTNAGRGPDIWTVNLS